jgi:hypothetical protein
MEREGLGRLGCVLPLRVHQTSATLSGFDEAMREPREYEAPLCAQTGNGDAWFPEQGYGTNGDIVYARNICNNCIHKIECAEWGIHKERFGVWGGLTAYDRTIIRRKRGIVLPREERSA